MDNRDRSILYQVAFKAAIEKVETVAETEDLVGEVFALTDVFYEGLETRINSLGGGSGNSGGSQKSGGFKPSSNGSKTQASTQSGNTDNITIKEPDAPASEAQVRLLNQLGYQGDASQLNKQAASDMIQSLKG